MPMRRATPKPAACRRVRVIRPRPATLPEGRRRAPCPEGRAGTDLRLRVHERRRIGGTRAVGAGGLALVMLLTSGATAALASTEGVLTAERGGLRVAVGSYTDCSGRSILQTGEAAVDPCIPGRAYFLGHNPGVFTPLLSTRVGDHITWTEMSGRTHQLRIIAVRRWVAADGVPPVVQSGVAAQFQTCLTPDGSLDLVLDAVEETP